MNLEGLEDYMLECTNKSLFGVECLGCGIQRATALLFRGEFIAAFKMYPAIYTLLILALVVILNLFIKFRFAFQIKVGLLLLNVIIIIISYVIKMNAVL
ncbi:MULTISPECIES: DUF2752 domain-containing protein [Altibacter]|uniref:DUF2752 domain-containing protein n=1 Tax=Altibacter TaxID=1535231 RepID=UPI000551A8E8|nr:MULTISPECIES: DUF2752 domain-containing protein [Altibacter]MCW8980439.1 DUF2752 domain-containing protein [Altibacter sp.]MCW9036391.1 DUF2752 domain-containing protein [Altibacter sp.]